LDVLLISLLLSVCLAPLWRCQASAAPAEGGEADNDLEPSQSDEVETDLPSFSEEEDEVDEIFAEADAAKLQKLTRAIEFKYGENGRKKDIRRAARLLKDLVTGEDMVAMQALYELGDIYMLGAKGLRGVRRNLRQSLSYFNQSAYMGWGPALHIMSFAYASGFQSLLEPDEIRAVRLEHLATATGHFDAVMGMGFRWYYGHGVPKKCETALRYYKHAAQIALQEDALGNPPLGDADRLTDQTLQLYNKQQQLAAQQYEVLQYWEHQAKGGDPMAQYELAKLHEDESAAANMDRRRRVPPKSLELYQQAAEQNYPQALTDLGYMYIQGAAGETNITKAVEKAVECFEKAAELGDPTAQAALGTIHLTLLKPRNVALAKEYFVKAALQDNAEAFFYLGELEAGIHDREEQRLFSANRSHERMQRALRYYERSADYGSVSAMWREGQLYEQGFGTPPNCNRAVLAYKMVAETGNGVNDVRRGLQYYVEGDYEGALLTYALAAEQGYEVAQTNAAELYRTHKGCKGKHCASKAVRLHHRAVSQGNVASLHEGAMLRLSGRGDVDKDLQMGARQLKTAAQHGSLSSVLSLAELHANGKAAPYIDKDLGRAEENYRYVLESWAAEEEGPADLGDSGGKAWTRVRRKTGPALKLAQIRFNRWIRHHTPI